VSGAQQIWIYSHLTGGDVLFENSGNFTGRYIYYIAIHGNPNITDNTGTPHGVFIMTVGLDRTRISGTGRPLVFTLLDSQAYKPLLYDPAIPTGGLGLVGDPVAYRNFLVNNNLFVYASIFSKLSGVVSVPENATSVTITYPFYIGDPSTYALVVTPSWNTAVWVEKSTSSATVYFSNPAPAGATINWIVIRLIQ